MINKVVAMKSVVNPVGASRPLAQGDSPNRPYKIIAVLATFLLCSIASGAFAANIPMEAIAARVEGVVNYVSIKDGKSRRVEKGTGFSEGDKVITAGNGVVEIQFDTGDMMRMDNGTSLSIHSLHKTDNGSTFNIFSLWVGRVRNAVSRLATSESKFEYHTKAAIVGVAGSPDWIVETRVDPSTGKDKTDVDFLGQAGDKGKLYVKGMEGTLINLTPGFKTDIFVGKPPAPPSEIPMQRRQNLEKATAIKAPKEEKKEEKREEKREEKKEEKKDKDTKSEQTAPSTSDDNRDEPKKDNKESVANIPASPAVLTGQPSVDQQLVVNTLSQSVSTVIMPPAATTQTQATTLGRQSTAVSSTASQTTTITAPPPPATPPPPAAPPASTITVNIVPGR